MKYLLPLLALFLAGCVTPSTMMVNREGRLLRCATTGYGYGVMGAIAVSTAEQAHDRCVRDGRLVGFIPVPTVALGFGGDTIKKPVRVLEVNDNAQAAGLRVGDIILEIDSKPVETFFTILTVMNTKRAGDRVPLKVQRDQETITLSIVAAARE